MQSASPVFGANVRSYPSCINAYESVAATDMLPTKQILFGQGAKKVKDCILHHVGDLNKEHYIIATQDIALRRLLRAVPGVPLLFIAHGKIVLESPSLVLTCPQPCTTIPPLPLITLLHPNFLLLPPSVPPSILPSVRASSGCRCYLQRVLSLRFPPSLSRFPCPAHPNGFRRSSLLRPPPTSPRHDSPPSPPSSVFLYRLSL